MISNFYTAGGNSFFNGYVWAISEMIGVFCPLWMRPPGHFVAILRYSSGKVSPLHGCSCVLQRDFSGAYAWPMLDEGCVK